MGRGQCIQLPKNKLDHDPVDCDDDFDISDNHVYDKNDDSNSSNNNVDDNDNHQNTRDCNSPRQVFYWVDHLLDHKVQVVPPGRWKIQLIALIISLTSMMLLYRVFFLLFCPKND